MTEQDGYRIGMVGLGVMGRNLLLNMAEHGFAVAGYDNDPQKVDALRSEAGNLPIAGAETIVKFVSLLQKPRAMMLLVPAGKIVDTVIADLLPHLEPGDLIIDSGNSHFTDTDRRLTELSQKGISFLGMGISGGESGARHGPSLMPGGPEAAYQVVRPVLEACAASVNGDPCIAYLGPGSAGHYVKMVHNGIEYGIIQSIAEAYDLMHRGMQMDNAQLSGLFEEWNRGDLNSYLVEITAKILNRTDEHTGDYLIDLIKDSARQKGTGQWASQDALGLHVPTPTIDVAVAMRNLSGLEEDRKAIAGVFGAPPEPYSGDQAVMVERVRRTLHMTMLLIYAQGMTQLQAASRAYRYELDLATVARIWRGGCIIRSGFLEEIRMAYSRNPGLVHLLMDERIGPVISERASDMRVVLQTANGIGLPVPALATSLAYFDSLRSHRLPANLIQAQRDHFGAHSYERVDRSGTFHTDWSDAPPA